MLYALQICVLGFLGFIMSVQGNIVVYSQDLPHKITEEFLDMPAEFGPELPMDGLRGYLVTGEPEDGCSALQKPPLEPNFTGKWVVIVGRFNCSFEAKIRNAQAAGYDCAIVHNVNSSDLETMRANNSVGITIPSVFVSDVAGYLLSEEYVYTNKYYIMVNGDLPFNINTHLLLPFAIVVVMCLVIILVFMVVKCIKDRRRNRRHRLPRSALRKIPTCKFSKGDPYDTCAICLDDYCEGDRLRVLPCAHAYHAKCIDPWLTKNRRVCPVCKRRVHTAGDRTRHDSDSDTEPLVDSTPTTTQGGTFEEQQENPFVRAARFISRLRDRDQREADPEVAQEHEDSNDENNETQDTAPLIQATPERSRRSRSQRSRSVPRQRLEHSINTSQDTEGEIGVAAIPVAPSSLADPPSHINL